MINKQIFNLVLWLILDFYQSRFWRPGVAESWRSPGRPAGFSLGRTDAFSVMRRRHDRGDGGNTRKRDLRMTIPIYVACKAIGAIRRCRVKNSGMLSLEMGIAEHTGADDSGTAGRDWRANPQYRRCAGQLAHVILTDAIFRFALARICR
ncbi:MAG: hypothetical protein AB1560_06310 [Pseudomonadota bacterium]